MEKFYHTGMMLMLCGAYSNMLDRFLYGTVTDMVEFLFVRFAVFNLADALLCLGCLLLMISLWREEKAWKRE